MFNSKINTIIVSKYLFLLFLRTDKNVITSKEVGRPEDRTKIHWILNFIEQQPHLFA